MALYWVVETPYTHLLCLVCSLSSNCATTPEVFPQIVRRRLNHGAGQGNDIVVVPRHYHGYAMTAPRLCHGIGVVDGSVTELVSELLTTPCSSPSYGNGGEGAELPPSKREEREYSI